MSGGQHHQWTDTSESNKDGAYHHNNKQNKVDDKAGIHKQPQNLLPHGDALLKTEGQTVPIRCVSDRQCDDRCDTRNRDQQHGHIADRIRRCFARIELHNDRQRGDKVIQKVHEDRDPGIPGPDIE